MKPEAVEEIISRFEASLKFVEEEGSYDEAMQKAVKLFEWVRTNLEKMHTKEQLRADLSETQASWAEEKLFVAASRFLPQIVRFGVTRMADDMKDNLPAPPAGRPRIDFHTKRKIVAYIGQKVVKGYSLEQSKSSATRYFGISEASIQRVWDDRANAGEPDFRAVLKALQETD